MASAGPKIPYAGLRFVSALINAGIWLGIGFGLSFASSGSLAAEGRFGPEEIGGLGAGVVFLAALFGRAGAATSFLDLSHSGRVALPSRARWGGAASFDQLWPRAAAVALIAAPVAGLSISSAVPRLGDPSRVTACLFIGVVAAVFAAVQSVAISTPGTLGALSPPAQAAPASPAYLARRLALPQAFGNGVISAVIAAVTFSPAATMAGALGRDAAGTAFVIGAFVLLGSSGIVDTDRRLDRVERLDAPPPSKALRVASLTIAVLLFGLLGAGLGAVASGELPRFGYVVFKGLVGAAVAFTLAVPAGRAALAR